MILPPPHPDEPERLQRLRELGILDTSRDETYDRLTRLASRMFGSRIALVTLVDADRQWFKSRVGLEDSEGPRSESFCAHAVAGDHMLVVEDALLDARFVDHPAVTGDPFVRFYAGAPLRSYDGLPLGTLCVADSNPRAFPEQERKALEDLAAIVEGELRRHALLDTVARNLGKDRQLRTLLAALPEAAFACNSRDEVISANPTARALFNRRIRDMVGRPYASLFADVAKTDSADFDPIRTCVRGDGTTFPGRTRWQRLAVDGAELTIHTVRDVSDWLARERRLTEQAQLLEMANDAIVVTDAANRVTYWNRGAERMYGIGREAALGRDMAQLVIAEANPGMEGRFAQVLEGGGYWEGDLKHARADGTRLIVFSRWSAQRGDDGTVSILKINTDVTARKEVERLKDEFISVVSHELRTPLTSILASLDLLADFPAEEISASARDLAEMGRRNTLRLSRLVNDVLDIEKIASGRMSYAIDSLDVRVVLDDAIEAVHGLAQQRQVAIDASNAASPRAAADHQRLAQVLTNLLSNAVKYSPPGGRVEVSAHAQGPFVRIEVRDHGPGIPEEFAGRIFQRFAQAATPMTRSVEGSGLGLAICKGMVEGMGGRIGYHSVPGEGATFFIEVPSSES